MIRRQVTEVSVSSRKIAEPLTLAVVTDLHNGDYQDVIPWLKRADAILIVGDLVNRHKETFHNAVRFLRDAPDLAPTFYAIGNHEWKFKRRAAYWPQVEKSRVTVLDNHFVPFRGILLGGLSSAPQGEVDAGFLAEVDGEPAFKLLMCHQPEYFQRYVRAHDVDLTVAGHAHGGQVQMMGRGLYAPGQGWLPRWTHGFYFSGRLLVSRGMTNSTGLIRVNNPCELVMLRLQKDGTHEA